MAKLGISGAGLPPAVQRARRRHWRRHLGRLAVGAAAFLSPHGGKGAPRQLRAPAPITREAAEPELTPTVTVLTEYRLPPQWAYEDLIQEAAALHHVDAALVRAVVQVESAFDPSAVSSAGAQGLMQLMPEVSKELGVQNPFDPRENVMAGTRYLAQLLKAYDANVELALAGYNAGPGRVEQYDGIPPFPETQRYVKAITDLLAQ
jgi:soluble lytic murein transglycosylase-like protein